MEGIRIRKINADGLVNDLTVYLRPYPAVTVLRNRARKIAGEGQFLSDTEYWELPESWASAHAATTLWSRLAGMRPRRPILGRVRFRSSRGA
jgi:hypothetical protein